VPLKSVGDSNRVDVFGTLDDKLSFDGCDVYVPSGTSNCLEEDRTD